MRKKLQRAAYQIAKNNHIESVSPIIALRKLFIQEKRNRSLPGNPPGQRRVRWILKKL